MKIRLSNKIGEAIKKIYNHMKFKIKLRQMDDMWYFLGGNCFGLYPPSFYYTHTEEEIERITKKDIAELKAVLRKYEEENGLVPKSESGV